MSSPGLTWQSWSFYHLRIQFISIKQNMKFRKGQRQT
jgi:hypothetical protein